MFSTFIASHGVRALAVVCGVSLTTVYVWKHRNHIPRGHWATILNHCRDVRYDDLVLMERAARPDTIAQAA